jgi:hypothetical protein
MSNEFVGRSRLATSGGGVRLVAECEVVDFEVVPWHLEQCDISLLAF